MRELGRVLALEPVVHQGDDVAGALGDLEDEPTARVDRELRSGVDDTEGSVSRRGEEYGSTEK